MIKGLEAFSHGQIQDALNVLKIMERNHLTVDDVEKHIQNVIMHPIKLRKGFLRRTTKIQRMEMAKRKFLERKPCKRCDEKRRGIR